MMIERGKIFLVLLCLIFITGCQGNNNVSREDFSKILCKISKDKYQAHLVCKPVNDTIWIYLPYTPGRSGLIGTKEKGNDLYLEYDIASFNPYRSMEPAELKFLMQKILGEIRKLLLSSRQPYKFFVLVVTDIQNEAYSGEQWYIGYFNDIKSYSVGVDFSGEGYNRLVWHDNTNKVKKIKDKNEREISAAYKDKDGQHIDYYDMTLREFVYKQIKWRIYKRFNIEYNKTPFDVTAQEKKSEIISIIQTVLGAYDFKEFENFYLKDSSFLSGGENFIGYSLQEIEKYPLGKITRKPAF